MGQKIKKPHQTKSVIKEYTEERARASIDDVEECFVISLKHFDRKQGQRFHEWQESGMLADALETLSGYCSLPLYKQYSDKFTLYGNFPERSAYTHPPHVPQDANWARIHVDGTHILAGHVFRNTFFVVFLDQDHTFYITKGANN
ncbi:MAG: hypothetical protein E6Q24_09315 [Chitinophagaceae bacterium]|nr:MAG: hypothetical protein E6Q24_09315 [Chitinophagaceae bacterium]